MATRTISNAGGNWSATATWVEGIVPTAADDVVATSTSGNITADAGALCRSADFTNYIRTLTIAATTPLSIGDATAGTGNVALRFVVGMTVTRANASTSGINFVSTSATQQSIYTAGGFLGNTNFNGAGSSYILQDGIQVGSGGLLSHLQGTLNTNGTLVQTGSFAFNGSATRTLTLGSSELRMSGVGASTFVATSTGATLNANSSSLTFPGSTTAGMSFDGGGLTWNNMTIPAIVNYVQGAGVFTIIGSNTLNVLTINNPRNVTFTAGTTTTLTSLLCQATPAGIIDLRSTSTTNYTLALGAAGTATVTGTSIKNCTATGTNTPIVATKSVDEGLNVGWNITGGLNNNYRFVSAGDGMSVGEKIR